MKDRGMPADDLLEILLQYRADIIQRHNNYDYEDRAIKQVKTLMLDLIGEPDRRYDTGRYNMTIELRNKVEEL